MKHKTYVDLCNIFFVFQLDKIYRYYFLTLRPISNYTFIHVLIITPIAKVIFSLFTYLLDTFKQLFMRRFILFQISTILLMLSLSNIPEFLSIVQ